VKEGLKKSPPSRVLVSALPCSVREALYVNESRNCLLQCPAELRGSVAENSRDHEFNDRSPQFIGDFSMVSVGIRW